MGKTCQGPAIGRIGTPRLLCSIPFPLIQPLPCCPRPWPKPCPCPCPCWRVSDRSQCESPSACSTGPRRRQSQRATGERAQSGDGPAQEPRVPQPGGRRRATTQSDTVLTICLHTDTPTDYDIRQDRQATCTSPSHLLLASSACFCGLPLYMALEAFVGLLESPSSPAGSPSSQARLANFCLGRAYDGQAPLLENHARPRPSFTQDPSLRTDSIPERQ